MITYYDPTSWLHHIIAQMITHHNQMGCRSRKPTPIPRQTQCQSRCALLESALALFWQERFTNVVGIILFLLMFAIIRRLVQCYAGYKQDCLLLISLFSYSSSGTICGLKCNDEGSTPSSSGDFGTCNGKLSCILDLHLIQANYHHSHSLIMHKENCGK